MVWEAVPSFARLTHAISPVLYINDERYSKDEESTDRVCKEWGTQ